ncbi:hypothetical protein QYE76_023104 [Lolium multiflorum]|uniref:Uncharacterized protein n=1 Tax=Lolium multiflorum TaxID=4521 RepID=A0AAD8RAS5_LOLMU|nr:hypothetical protein QYE76_023104 [Lolium multiflorum]
MQVDTATEVLSDEVLEMVTNMEALAVDEAEQLSMNAISGTDADSTIQLPARVNNLTVLLLVDSDSTRSFIDAAMVSKLGLIPQSRSPIQVKVANGEQLPSSSSELEPEVDRWLRGPCPEHWDARDGFLRRTQDDEPLTDGEEDLRLIDRELEVQATTTSSPGRGFSSDGRKRRGGGVLLRGYPPAKRFGGLG